MARVWTPGREGTRLAPHGFDKRTRIVGSPNYVLDHPTRYEWEPHVETMIRKLYRELGGPRDVPHKYL